MTGAAVIMVAVFSILATLSLIQLKVLGVGLAAAVLIDATVVRGILVPASLAMLAERAWRPPRWLARSHRSTTRIWQAKPMRCWPRGARPAAFPAPRPPGRSTASR